jgi:ribonuclease H / adenosylcobalamin/alpha-ribazole phosphatase
MNTERIILVRHGETVNNVDGITQGWSDSELSPRGLIQVQSVAARIAPYGPTSVFSSTLKRAMSTAEAIATTFALDVQPLEELRELNCGEWEGVSFLKVRKDDPEFYRRWLDDPALACPGGESFEDLSRRMARAFELIGQSDTSPAEMRTAVVVSHATAIRVAATVLLQLPLAAARGFAQENAAVNVFEWRNGRYVLRVWNETTHWAALPSRD